MSEDHPTTSGTIKKKKDDKHRRRDPKAWDNVRKSAISMTEEERINYYSKMYNEIYSENRILFSTLGTREKQLLCMQKDSDRDRSELTKSILARGQLESLCRELQKQNRLIKEENVARIKEEEDRRREVANTFTERLNALTNLITESKDKSNKVKEENQSMTEKLTELYEQYQQRENHLETVTKQLELQKKLAETQAKKTEIEHEAERQTYLAEKKALVMQLEQYEREIVLLQEKNRSLEAQVDLYKSQYSDFETTMTKSNKVFDTFKEEMSRMNKQLHALESERNDLRKRWQSSVNSLIVLSEQHVALSNEQSALEKRLAMLQKLCRQLQEDRSAFLKQLKENNIEPVVSSVKNNENSESDASEKNLETSKSSQCALKLKQELGKVKEVAALMKMANDPPIDEDDAATDLSDILDEDFASIQEQIEAADLNIEELLSQDASTSDLTPKRFKSAGAKPGPKPMGEGEGDASVAGPSGLIPSAPSTVTAPAPVVAETETQTKVVVTDESAIQNVVHTVDTASQPDEIDETLSVRRAPAAMDLIREQVPSQVSLTEDGVADVHIHSSSGTESNSTSTLGEVRSADNLGIQDIDSQEEIHAMEGLPDIEEESTTSESPVLTPRPRVVGSFMEEVPSFMEGRPRILPAEESTSSSSLARTPSPISIEDDEEEMGNDDRNRRIDED